MKIFKMAAILTLTLLSHLAAAHSGLKHSTPGNGSILNKSPEALILEFTAPVKLVRVQLTDPSGKVIKLLSKPSKSFATRFTMVLPAFDSGSYSVKWLAMGKDAHKMKGHFTFIVNALQVRKVPGSADSHNPA